MSENDKKNTIKLIGYTNKTGKKSEYKCEILDRGDIITISKNTFMMLVKSDYVENVKVVQDKQGVCRLKVENKQ